VNAASKPPNDTVVRSCAQCGATLQKRENEWWTIFANRKFCSNTCAWEHRRLEFLKQRPNVVKHCQSCNTPLVQKPTEHNTNFSQRRYCNHQCSVDHSRNRRTKNVERARAVAERKRAVVENARGINALDDATRRLFLDALDHHPELLQILADPGANYAQFGGSKTRPFGGGK
jgi:hypothetical protein